MSIYQRRIYNGVMSTLHLTTADLLCLIRNRAGQVQDLFLSYQDRASQLIREVMWRCNEAENVSRNRKEEGETGEGGRLLSVMVQNNLQEVCLAGEHEHPARNLGHANW